MSPCRGRAEEASASSRPEHVGGHPGKPGQNFFPTDPWNLTLFSGDCNTKIERCRSYASETHPVFFSLVFTRVRHPFYMQTGVRSGGWGTASGPSGESQACMRLRSAHRRTARSCQPQAHTQTGTVPAHTGSPLHLRLSFRGGPRISHLTGNILSALGVLKRPTPSAGLPGTLFQCDTLHRPGPNPGARVGSPGPPHPPTRGTLPSGPGPAVRRSDA